MGDRRKAREHTLQMLFESDINRSRVKQEDRAPALPAPKAAAVKAFTERLLQGVAAHEAEINALIKKYTQNWSPERIAVVDRNILRFAIFELLYLDDVPASVTINEAIEIAKTFGSEDSGKFVNGILDRIRLHEGAEKASKEALKGKAEA